MRIAIVASPFILIPPSRYGGTELFISNLAEGLGRSGIHAAVYCNGESTVNAEKRWCYPKAEWPLETESSGMFKELEHVAWSVQDAGRDCDLIHINSASAVSLTRFVSAPFVCTVHHAYEQALTSFYERHPEIFYAAISHHQASLHPTLDMRIIHHGLDFRKYRLRPKKEDYLCFLGRIAPMKGTHLAIEVALKAGIPLKIAGEIQPIFRSYFDKMVKPHLDGTMIEYVGEVGLEEKNQLLGCSRGMLFPIQWEEPFGLVLVEAMACGTPVFAFRSGAVAEIVLDGVSGRLCSSVEEMVSAVTTSSFTPRAVRGCAEAKFSVEHMVNQYVDLYNSILSRKAGPKRMTSEAEKGTAA
ncbi:MAG TPA: glycosyltransferase family 4 protein [Acidobacteriaceae bacterium]|nr:glycosyltransferase family 4 protein [Acidobacteriaceae bacterium]